MPILDMHKEYSNKHAIYRHGIIYLVHWLQDEKWLNRSIDLYNWAWENGWDDPCGGFWWSTWPGQQFKDSVTIMEMLHFSSKLAFMYPKDSDYIKHAEKIWNWIYSFNNGTGLLTEKNLVSTGAMPELCCNSSTKILLKKCYSSKLSGTSYNQGLLLSSSAYLYSLTANEVYLDTGVKLLNAVLQNYTTTDGILIDEPRSGQTFRSQCVGGADPGGDWYSFNGIFMLHLAYFSDILSAKKALNGNMLAKIKMFVQNTSDAAWARSAVWPPFKEEDACDAGVKSKSNFPKFHWWWGEEKTRQILPPDSGLYLHKTYLRCVGAGTQLWDGPMYTEDKCEKKCSKNKLCSKYLFSTDQYHCWIWSYNRTNHICNQTDSDFNVGVKRPLGHASCKGICGSHKPQKLKHGVCYCDSNCTKHLDCCLDYAEECVQDSDYLSCQGFCKKAHAQAIRGGGYCWCFDGCNPNFTDNNSMGSCCPDYPEKCLGVNMPTCMDARSQGSALNLFLAHLKISNL